MTREQKTVAIGAASGIISMVLLVWIFSSIFPVPDIENTFAERVAYALRLNMLAVIPLFIMIISVGNQRFLSKAIDPLRHAEDVSMEIDSRVVENTLQQNFVFFVATLALSTVLSFEYLQILLALTMVFILARTIFWFGYRIHPLYRAPGMSATAYMNLGIILYVLYTLIW